MSLAIYALLTAGAIYAAPQWNPWWILCGAAAGILAAEILFAMGRALYYGVLIPLVWAAVVYSGAFMLHSLCTSEHAVQRDIWMCAGAPHAHKIVWTVNHAFGTALPMLLLVSRHALANAVETVLDAVVKLMS